MPTPNEVIALASSRTGKELSLSFSPSPREADVPNQTLWAAALGKPLVEFVYLLQKYLDGTGDTASEKYRCDGSYQPPMSRPSMRGISNISSKSYDL